MIVTLERLAFTHQARVVYGYVCMDYIRVLEGILRTCVLDHKGRGLIALSGIRLQQQLSGEYTDGTVCGIVWEVMQVTIM